MGRRESLEFRKRSAYIHDEEKEGLVGLRGEMVYSEKQSRRGKRGRMTAEEDTILKISICSFFNIVEVDTMYVANAEILSACWALSTASIILISVNVINILSDYENLSNTFPAP